MVFKTLLIAWVNHYFSNQQVYLQTCNVFFKSSKMHKSTLQNEFNRMKGHLSDAKTSLKKQHYIQGELFTWKS